jgi:hypothetical protein
MVRGLQRDTSVMTGREITAELIYLHPQNFRFIDTKVESYSHMQKNNSAYDRKTPIYTYEYNK